MKIDINRKNNPKEKTLTKPAVTAKETWSTPSIIELGVNDTLGGHIAGTSESYTGTGS